jgi:hypothetical protein
MMCRLIDGLRGCHPQADARTLCVGVAPMLYVCIHTYRCVCVGYLLNRSAKYSRYASSGSSMSNGFVSMLASKTNGSSSSSLCVYTPFEGWMKW